MSASSHKSSHGRSLNHSKNSGADQTRTSSKAGKSTPAGDEGIKVAGQVEPKEWGVVPGPGTILTKGF